MYTHVCNKYTHGDTVYHTKKSLKRDVEIFIFLRTREFVQGYYFK